MDNEIRNIGIMIFDEVEVLDFAGPYEVFSQTRLSAGVESRSSGETAPFTVFTVAKTETAIRARGGLSINPDYSFSSAPAIDLLLVPGGLGTRALLEDEESLNWIKQLSDQATRLASVCTGTLLLAKLGLLKNKKATTHWAALDLLISIDDSISIQAGQRYVDDGIITSAGVSAGMDMSLAIVQQLHGAEVAEDTARFMEYRWNR